MIEPYSLDGAYAPCFREREMTMDRRHIYVVHEILATWPFSNALELGCFRGASSTAFVQAINRGGLKRAMFCDVDVTDELRMVAESCWLPHRVSIVEMASWDVLDTPVHFDFVLVDANHEEPQVKRELESLLRRKPACIMAHDTNATAAGYASAEGAAMLKREWSILPEYTCIEDNEKRPGEETHRGLFCATRGEALSSIARAAFEKFCGRIV